MAIYRQKSITRHFVELYRNYWEFSISMYAEYGKLWFASVYVENWNYDPRNKFHAIPRFPTGSFAVYIGDHLRSNLGITSGQGIICGRGSSAALYSTPTHAPLIQKETPRKQFRSSRKELAQLKRRVYTVKKRYLCTTESRSLFISNKRFSYRQKVNIA